MQYNSGLFRIIDLYLFMKIFMSKNYLVNREIYKLSIKDISKSNLSKIRKNEKT